MRPSTQTSVEKQDSTQKSHWRKWVYWGGLIIGIVFFAIQIKVGIQSLNKYNYLFDNLLWLIPAIFVAITAPFLQMISWLFIFKGLGHNLSWKSVFEGYVLSFIPRYIPGSIWGYLSRGEWMKRTFGIHYGITNIGSILEVVIILSANIGWILSGFFASYLLRIAVLSLAFVIGCGALYILKKPFLYPLIIKLTGRESVNNLKNFPTSGLLSLLLLMIIYWGLLGIAFQFVIWGMSPANGTIQWSLNSIWYITSNYALAWFIGFVIIFIPSGIGVRELVLSNLIGSRLKLTNVSSAAIPIIFRLILGIGELFWIAIAVIKKRKQFLSQNTKKALIADNSPKE